MIGKVLLILLLGALLAYACITAWVWALFKDIPKEPWGE